MPGEHAAPRGRPRSPEVDLAIRRAVVGLLQEHGYPELSIEGVAIRAGVAKTTIYRRFPSKGVLVAHALFDTATDAVPVPDTGTLRGDLVAMMRTLIALVRHDYWSRAIPALAAEATDDPRLDELVRGFTRVRLEMVEPLFDRAVARGEVRPGVDRELVGDLLVGAVHHRRFISRRPLDDQLAERAVDLVLRAISA
jgi:AcrR family transcriptional regulator